MQYSHFPLKFCNVLPHRNWNTVIKDQGIMVLTLGGDLEHVARARRKNRSFRRKQIRLLSVLSNRLNNRDTI